MRCASRRRLSHKVLKFADTSLDTQCKHGCRTFCKNLSASSFILIIALYNVSFIDFTTLDKTSLYKTKHWMVHLLMYNTDRNLLKSGCLYQYHCHNECTTQYIYPHMIDDSFEL